MLVSALSAHITGLHLKFMLFFSGLACFIIMELHTWVLADEPHGQPEVYGWILNSCLCLYSLYVNGH